MSAPPSRLRTGSRSAPATARYIIFTSGGKWRRGATERGAEPLHFRGVRAREKNRNAEIRRVAGGRRCARRRGFVAAAARPRGGGASGAVLRQRGRSRNQPGRHAEIPRGAEGRRRGDGQGGRGAGIR